jgi:hypothetical protein
MTQDEIIELAVQAGMNREALPLMRNLELLTAFAKLVAQRDRGNILAVIGDNQCECRCSEVVRDGGLL